MGEAVPERMALSDQTGQKPRCIRRARKMFPAHVLEEHHYRTALTKQMERAVPICKCF